MNPPCGLPVKYVLDKLPVSGTQNRDYPLTPWTVQSRILYKPCSRRPKHFEQQGPKNRLTATKNGLSRDVR